MLDYEYESLFARSAATYPASRGSRNPTSRDCENLRGLGTNHQALSQTTTRERSRFAKGDSRSSCKKRSAVAGQLESATRNPSRCQARRALPTVRGHVWHPGESGQHQSCQNGSGLDAKKKTLSASEQNETARAAWREQAAHLCNQDLVFIDETGSHIAMTPLYAYAPR
jgi:hypothetical protein